MGLWSLVRWHKRLALACALLWTGLGLVAIGGILLSLTSWRINLFMGALFVGIGWFSYARVNAFCRGFTAMAVAQNNPHIRRFLLLDLILVVGVGLIGALLLVASLSRVFGEGYAVFG